MSAPVQSQAVGNAPDHGSRWTVPSGSGQRSHHVRKPSDRRRRSVLSALLALIALLFGICVLLGTYTVTLPDFFRIVAGADIPGVSFIVMDVKVPRAVVGLLVGMAFGVAGAIFQTMLRNPLASPDIIGISYGASAAAVTGIVVFGAAGAALSGIAFGGALVVAMAIYAISRRGDVAGYRLILVGIGFAAVLQAIVSFLMTRTDVQTAQDALVWMSGSLNPSDWDRAGMLAISLAILLPVTALMSRGLHLLELGDDTAAGLGLRVEPVRLGLMVAGVALCAVATAAAGPVAFIAFLSGPIARRLLRGRPSLPAAGLVGASIVLAADFVAANMIPGTSLPVGVVTGALGAPFLLWLLVTSNRTGQGG